LAENPRDPATDAVSHNPRAKGWQVVLANQNIRRFLIGETASSIGSGMVPVAVTFAALATYNSTSSVGFVLAAGAVPLVAFLIIGGAIADRVGARKAMLAADILRSAAQLGLGLWIVFGHPSLLGFMLLQAFVGVGTGVFMPASTALIPALADKRTLQQANAFRHLASSFGRLLGPAVAGVVVARASPGWAIVIDGLSYALSVGFLWSLRLLPGVAASGGTLIVQLRQGWHEFWTRDWLWAIVGQAGLLGISAWPVFYVLGAVVARASLGGAAVWGLILSAMGAGTIVGGLLSLRLNTRRPLLIVALIPAFWFLPLLGLAFDAPAATIALAAFVVGAGGSVSMSLWDTTMQTEIPPAVLARVSSYDLTTSFALLPIGYAAVGPVSIALGIQRTFLLAVVIVLLAVLAVLILPSVTRPRPEDKTLNSGLQIP
jgi:MFS family permease